MTHEETWAHYMTPHTPADFPSEHSLRNALQKITITRPQITDLQQQQIVEHWKAHRT